MKCFGAILFLLIPSLLYAAEPLRRRPRRSTPTPAVAVVGRATPVDSLEDIIIRHVIADEVLFAQATNKEASLIPLLMQDRLKKLVQEKMSAILTDIRRRRQGIGRPILLERAFYADNIIYWLRRGAALSKQDIDSLDLLELASGADRADLVTLLIERGADLNKLRMTGVFCATPLHTASRWGRDAIVEILLDAGADTTVVSGFRATALHAAALGGHPKVVELLLEEGSAVNARDRCGDTPLDYVWKARSHLLVDALLAAGAQRGSELRIEAEVA